MTFHILNDVSTKNETKGKLINILKDFENTSPRFNPLFHKPLECQRNNCYCISLFNQFEVGLRKFMVVDLL